MSLLTTHLRLRVSPEHAHYGGDLVDGAFILRLFGDLVTEVAIRTDGVEGLLSGYERVQFLAPVHPGDYLEVEARVTRMTALRREVECEARRVIAARYVAAAAAVEFLTEPEVVARATGTVVIPYAVARRRKSA